MKEQLVLFDKIKEKLPINLSLVDQIESVLNVSTDSAYRRIRGDKELTVSELKKLAEHFNISLDSVLGNSASEVTFKYRALNPRTFTFKDYIENALNILKPFEYDAQFKVIYAAKDIPLFHHFFDDLFGAFKQFAWQKTILGFDEFNNRTFARNEIDEGIVKTGKNLLKVYNSFPSLEIWQEDLLSSSLKQIEFYAEARLFSNNDDAFALLDSLDVYLDHLKKQAAIGKKFDVGLSANDYSGDFELYKNDIVRTDNTILAAKGPVKMIYLTHYGMNFLTTSNVDFCNTTETFINNVLKRSTLISTVGENSRNNLFSLLSKELITREKKFVILF